MITVFTSAQTNRTEGENKPEFDLIVSQQNHKQRSSVVLADDEPLDFCNLVPFAVAAKTVASINGSGCVMMSPLAHKETDAVGTND